MIVNSSGFCVADGGILRQGWGPVGCTEDLGFLTRGKWGDMEGLSYYRCHNCYLTNGGGGHSWLGWTPSGQETGGRLI